MTPFSKMAGCGNDFVVMLATQLPRRLSAHNFGRAICAPGSGVGADGLVLVDPTPRDGCDFSISIINRSGLPAEMCGNAARCIGRWAFDRGIAPAAHSFSTLAGRVEASVSPERVTLLLPDPSPVRLEVSFPLNGETLRLDVIDVGVPHAVLWWDDIENAPVDTLGRRLRHHPLFPHGANINFGTLLGDGKIRVRTFERGVEAETLSCGTGSCATAIAAAARGLAQPPTKIRTTHGDLLEIGFALDGFSAKSLTLSGPAGYIFDGTLDETWLATQIAAGKAEPD